MKKLELLFCTILIHCDNDLLSIRNYASNIKLITFTTNRAGIVHYSMVYCLT